LIPTAQFSSEETGSGIWRPDRLTTALDSFRSRGCLWIQGAFQPSFIHLLNAAFMEGEGNRIQDEAATRNLVVGDRRLMVPVELKGPFNDPELYAPPLVCAFMEGTLGLEFRLGGFGVVVSLPGARDQHIHSDHPALFGMPIDDFLPSFAVTMIVPMVDMNAMNGATRVWEESHLTRYHAANAGIPMDKRNHEDPFTRVGDCLLMDYRLHHAGLENRSDAARPILYITYFRPWFKDYVNYRKHPPLTFGEGEYDKVPAELKPLFANASGIPKL
jgi:hypothetical protein